MPSSIFDPFRAGRHRRPPLRGTALAIAAAFLLPSAASARDEVVVILPTKSEVLEEREREELTESVRNAVLAMEEDLEMDILTDRETRRALRRWAGSPRCADDACDLEAAAKIGAEIVVLSKVAETRSGLLELELVVMDLRDSAKKRSKAKDKKNGDSKGRSLGSGAAKMRSFKKLKKQAAVGVETLFEQAFFEPIDDKPPPKKARGKDWDDEEDGWDEEGEGSRKGRKGRR